jgi:hypothetical protein
MLAGDICADILLVGQYAVNRPRLPTICQQDVLAVFQFYIKEK